MRFRGLTGVWWCRDRCKNLGVSSFCVLVTNPVAETGRTGLDWTTLLLPYLLAPVGLGCLLHAAKLLQYYFCIFAPQPCARVLPIPRGGQGMYAWTEQKRS